MRVTHWTLEGAPAVTMLLPDGYVRRVLCDYNSTHPNPLSVTLCGRLTLHRADEVPIVFCGLSDAELDSERALFGSRLWIHVDATNSFTVDKLPIVPMRSGASTYCTQNTAVGEQGAVAGTRVVADAEVHVFDVVTSCNDPFSGVRVRWANASGRPILDADLVQ
jgi:hypothetical protein